MGRIEMTPTGRGITEKAQGMRTAAEPGKPLQHSTHACLTCKQAVVQRRGIVTNPVTMCRLFMAQTAEVTECEAFEARQPFEALVIDRKPVVGG